MALTSPIAGDKLRLGLVPPSTNRSPPPANSSPGSLDSSGELSHLLGVPDPLDVSHGHRWVPGASPVILGLRGTGAGEHSSRLPLAEPPSRERPGGAEGPFPTQSLTHPGPLAPGHSGENYPTWFRFDYSKFIRILILQHHLMPKKHL